MPGIISAPMDLIVAVHQEIEIRFAGLGLTSDLPPSRYAAGARTDFEFHLCGVNNDETRRLDLYFHDALKSWTLIVQDQGEEHAGPAPHIPGNAVLEPVKANITDDHGTRYTCIGGRVAGTGTDWNALWVYSPHTTECSPTIGFGVHH